MGSIRPLVTITILIVVGAYLYLKINEGPVAPVPGTADPWESQSDVPPLASTVGPTATTETTAPSWPATQPATPPAENASSAAASDQFVPATADVATLADTLPAVPAIPELPAMPAAADTATSTSTDLSPLPGSLPANIPTAHYPNEPTATGTAALSDPFSSQPSSTAATPAASAQIPATNSIVSEATPPLTSQPPATPTTPAAEAPLSQNPLRQPATPPAAADPYAPIGTTPSQSTAATPAAMESSFAASWPEIQTALDRRELGRAHQLLSQWYDHPSLTPTDAQRVETLLSQLAGTVVYSTEHQLKPAHVVKPGETLEAIAKQHNVPWQLLAKINGIPAADQLRPGQELKVVPGPFSAVVELRRSQLTLMVDGRYAGKFPVSVPVGAAVGEGAWLVDQKLAAPGNSGVAQSSYTPAPASVERTIVLRSDPGTGQPAVGSTLTIASGAPPTGTATSSPAIQISPQDAEELSDILSIGSRVVIRR